MLKTNQFVLSDDKIVNVFSMAILKGGAKNLPLRRIIQMAYTFGQSLLEGVVLHMVYLI